MPKRMSKWCWHNREQRKAATRLRHIVSDASGQRRELPLEPHPKTGTREPGAALFAPTVLQHAWEQAALPPALWTSAI